MPDTSNLHIMRFIPCDTPEYQKSITALIMALGCFVDTEDDGTVTINTVEPMDDILTIDTLTEAGATFLGYITLDDYLKEAI